MIRQLRIIQVQVRFHYYFGNSYETSCWNSCGISLINAFENVSRNGFGYPARNHLRFSPETNSQFSWNFFGIFLFGDCSANFIVNSSWRNPYGRITRNSFWHTFGNPSAIPPSIFLRDFLWDSFFGCFSMSSFRDSCQNSLKDLYKMSQGLTQIFYLGLLGDYLCGFLMKLLQSFHQECF